MIGVFAHLGLGPDSDAFLVWEDMRTRFESSDIPQWQKDLLDHRRARVRDGTAKILDWDSVNDFLHGGS